jgi:two-component system, OmpR family, response regulator
MILVVEDDELQRHSVVNALRDDGHAVVHTATGEDALVFLRTMQGRVHWLYVDIRLPGVIDGWCVADQFRFSHPLRPVVYASGHSSDRERCVPGSVFFEKPFDPLAVVATFRHLSNRMIIDMMAFPPQPRVAMKGAPTSLQGFGGGSPQRG